MMLADAFHTYMDNKYGSKTNDLIDLQSEHEALQEQVDELQQQADDMQDQISNLIFQRDEIKQQQ